MSQSRRITDADTALEADDRATAEAKACAAANATVVKEYLHFHTPSVATGHVAANGDQCSSVAGSRRGLFSNNVERSPRTRYIS